MVNIAFLIGGIASWGLLFPFLETKSGQWYHTTSPSSLAGINGYKVCGNNKVLIGCKFI
jgi:hypothetical protein